MSHYNSLPEDPEMKEMRKAFQAMSPARKAFTIAAIGGIGAVVFLIALPSLVRSALHYPLETPFIAAGNALSKGFRKVASKIGGAREQRRAARKPAAAPVVDDGDRDYGPSGNLYSGPDW